MNCPIHLGEIALDTERAAALPCGHVFCLSCITRCFDVKKTKSVSCPICKRATTKNQIIPLFWERNSPSSPPAKSQGSEYMSTAGKTFVRALLQHLQTPLATMRSVDLDDAHDACSYMVPCANSTPEALGIGDKSLAEEVKAAALHLQNAIRPELHELSSVRAQAKDLGEENAHLKSTLLMKDAEINRHNRRRISAEMEVADLKLAKKLTDDRASSFRESLSVKSDRLVEAENTIRDKEELIQKKDADIKQYRRWAADYKTMTEKYKAQIKELEMRLLEDGQMAHSTVQGEGSSRGSIVASEPLLPSEHDDQDGAESPGRPPKRQRTEDKLTLADMTLDKTCFVKKPPPSFRIPIKNRPEKRTASFSGLNVTNGGRVKGLVVLGSRQRLGKNG